MLLRVQTMSKLPHKRRISEGESDSNRIVPIRLEKDRGLAERRRRRGEACRPPGDPGLGVPPVDEPAAVPRRGLAHPRSTAAPVIRVVEAERATVRGARGGDGIRPDPCEHLPTLLVGRRAERAPVVAVVLAVGAAMARGWTHARVWMHECVEPQNNRSGRQMMRQ